MPILRGEVYYVELGPTRGRELDLKRRPVVVVSINDINLKPLVVAVVPGTTHVTARRVFRNQVKVDPTSENGLTNSTLFDCIQIKALDYSRFDRGPVGRLSSDDMIHVVETIQFTLGLDLPTLE
jgi:mRNA-degrading endonuclease toxin of MazEF toxin-antitoxin module